MVDLWRFGVGFQCSVHCCHRAPVDPFWARSVCHQLRKVGYQSVWSLACQDEVVGHAGVCVVSLGGAPLALLSFVSPQFKEFFRLGRGFQDHSSYWKKKNGSSICGLWESGGGGGC